MGAGVIQSDYRLDDWGSVPITGKRFSSSLRVQTSSWCPPSLLSNGYRGPFLGIKRDRGVTLTTPHLVPRSKWVGATHPIRLSACMACSRAALQLSVALKDGFSSITLAVLCWFQSLIWTMMDTTKQMCDASYDYLCKRPVLHYDRFLSFFHSYSYCSA
jgi:hypothetical protein